MLADDVAPCLLRPICSSAITVAAIAPNQTTPLDSRCLPDSLLSDPPRTRVCLYTEGVLYTLVTRRRGLCAPLSRRGGIHVRGGGAAGPLCVFLCVLSWLNSCSTETNYNEARLVGRESAMFSFLRSLPPPPRPFPIRDHESLFLSILRNSPFLSFFFELVLLKGHPLPSLVLSDGWNLADERGRGRWKRERMRCNVSDVWFFGLETMVEFFVGFLLDRKCLFFILFSPMGGCCNSMVLEEGLVKDFEGGGRGR